MGKRNRDLGGHYNERVLFRPAYFKNDGDKKEPR
jgi:hypothetical protein